MERYFGSVGEPTALAATIIRGIDSPEGRPAAIAAVEGIAPRHLVAGRQSQMAQLFALLKAEEQTVKMLETDHGWAIYPHWPVYDFLRGNARYEALLAKDQLKATSSNKEPVLP